MANKPFRHSSPYLLSEQNLKLFVQARGAILFGRVHHTNSVTFILFPKKTQNPLSRQDVTLYKRKNASYSADEPYIPASLILDSLKKMGL